MLTWFDWKEVVKMKLGLFPSFVKVFEDEGEALKDPKRSSVLYNVFKEKTLGGVAHTLVDSLGKNKKTGYHAFQALVQAMEGTETCERLKKHAEMLRDGAKKDSTTTFLEFQGNMQQYLAVLDKIEQLEGRTPLSEEKRIKLILKGVLDKDFQSTVLQLQRELQAGTLDSSEKVFSELRAVETHVETQDSEEKKTGSFNTSSFSRAKGSWL
jgi:hypothetical protein